MPRSFNGTSDRITIGDVIDLAGLTTFTVFAWVFPTSVTVGQRIISKWNGAAGDQYLFAMTSAGLIEVVAHDASGHQPLRDSSVAVSVNQWSAVAASMNGAAAANMSLYINGVASNGAASGSALVGGIQDTTQPLAIGDDAGAGATAPFHGLICHAAIWNVALTASEIAGLGGGALPTHVRPGSLQGYWPLWGVDSPEPQPGPSATRTTGTLTGTSAGSGNPAALSLLPLGV